MPWLVKEGKVLASVELARPRGGPMRGPIGDAPITGALMIEPARAAHSMRSHRVLDFAFLGLVLADASDGTERQGTGQEHVPPKPLASSPVGAAVGVSKTKAKLAMGKAKSVSRALAPGRSEAKSTPEDGDREYRVLRVVTLEPNRIVKPELRAVAAIEAEAGAFERWGLTEGDTIRIELRQ